MLPDRFRRLLVLSGFAMSLRPQAARARSAAAQRDGPAARALVFPRDFGSHPQVRTEWWYVTGHSTVGSGAAARTFGFQLTFFRARVDETQAMVSRFAARQLLFAHAALSDIQGKRFWHDQRIARQGFEVASASEQDTRIRLRDWSLVRESDHYRARVAAREFDLNLALSQTQGVLLQGTQGLSRKGPQPEQASYYYSQPQLALEGDISILGARFALRGEGARHPGGGSTHHQGAAWLDHEWSDSLLHPAAVGWDWIGMNLYDGSTLTAFRVRDKAGDVLWDGGSFRHPTMKASDKPYAFARGEVIFQALRSWKSPLTQAAYPVEWLLRTPADHYVVRSLLDNQELDSRNSTGAVYWEGLSDLYDSNNKHVGRGYLEMTGYARPLVL